MYGISERFTSNPKIAYYRYRLPHFLLSENDQLYTQLFHQNSDPFAVDNYKAEDICSDRETFSGSIRDYGRPHTGTGDSRPSYQDGGGSVRARGPHWANYGLFAPRNPTNEALLQARQQEMLFTKPTYIEADRTEMAHTEPIGSKPDYHHRDDRFRTDQSLAQPQYHDIEPGHNSCLIIQH